MPPMIRQLPLPVAYRQRLHSFSGNGALSDAYQSPKLQIEEILPMAHPSQLQLRAQQATQRVAGFLI